MKSETSAATTRIGPSSYFSFRKRRIERLPDVVPGYPDLIVAKPGCEEKLKKRTLTNLYNERPAWLANVHQKLDVAVAKAYGWDDYSDGMSDEEILGRLLKLNLERSKPTGSA